MRTMLDLTMVAIQVGGPRSTTREKNVVGDENMNASAWCKSLVCGLGIAAAISATGCQVSVGGQTLPSPWYTRDDVQYYPSGPEMVVSREAAAIQAYNAQRQLPQGGQGQ